MHTDLIIQASNARPLTTIATVLAAIRSSDHRGDTHLLQTTNQPVHVTALRAWKLAARSTAKYVFVIEDDVEVGRFFTANAVAMLERAAEWGPAPLLAMFRPSIADAVFGPGFHVLDAQERGWCGVAFATSPVVASVVAGLLAGRLPYATPAISEALRGRDLPDTTIMDYAPLMGYQVVIPPHSLVRHLPGPSLIGTNKNPPEAYQEAESYNPNWLWADAPTPAPMRGNHVTEASTKPSLPSVQPDCDSARSGVDSEGPGSAGRS